MNSIKEMVKDKVVRFKFYRDKELVYQTEDGFEFSVPIEDAGTGIFKAEDKAILFMRWIRKAMEQREEWEVVRKRESQGVARRLYEDDKHPTYEEMLAIEEQHSPMIGRR